MEARKIDYKQFDGAPKIVPHLDEPLLFSSIVEISIDIYISLRYKYIVPINWYQTLIFQLYCLK